MKDFAFNIKDRGLQYLGATRIEGSLVVVERIRDVGYDETVEILGRTDDRASAACSTFRKLRPWCRFWKGQAGFPIRLCASVFSGKVFGCQFHGKC